MASPTRHETVTGPAPLLALAGVTKVYGVGEAAVRALDGVDFEVWPGDFVAITGASGSGKTTVVSILGCLEASSAGEYRIEGVSVQALSADVLAALRNAKFGFVFQNYNLLSRTSALENVALPLVYAGVGRVEREARARAALAEVGLEGREESRSNQLSGGQQQRVAIARALVNAPEVILADEPTGNLDSRTGRDIMELSSGLNRDRGITVLMVTHDPACAAWARRRVVFQDGRIRSDTRGEVAA
ncbi:MAG: ABC transporter ATP-binding protein [Myxococcaceae bacterium]|nr:ABC transporter ATP-binding protein [Myxococcaceae bacterium]